MCGIFGFAGKLGNHEFNILKFATLGVINDTRGGDSAGAFIDKDWAYGVNDEKLFASFAVKNEFLRSHQDKEVQYALGHCRKASVGAKTIKEAQPVVIHNDEETDVDFVMIHNGTLLNHDELKKEYLDKVPKHFTDSQIFANVVYYYGFKVLTEYQGAGAFAFLDYRKKSPILYLFKGASLTYSTSTALVEERPLYWVKKEEGIWFSSIKESLEIISLGQDTVESVPTNTLIGIQNGKVVFTKAYDRSKNHQLNYSTTRTYGYGKSIYDYDDYDYGYGTNYHKTSQPVKKTNDLFTGLAERKYYSASGFIVDESVKRYDTEVSNKIIFKDGRYYCGTKLLNGPVKISEYGFKNVYSSIGSAMVTPPKTFWFFEGYLLKDALSWEIAKKIQEKSGERFQYDMLRKLVMTSFWNPNTRRFYTRKGKVFTGKYPVWFDSTNRIYYISQGAIYQYSEQYEGGCSIWRTYTPQYNGNDVATKYASLINKSAAKILAQYNITF